MAKGLLVHIFKPVPTYFEARAQEKMKGLELNPSSVTLAKKVRT